MCCADLTRMVMCYDTEDDARVIDEGKFPATLKRSIVIRLKRSCVAREVCERSPVWFISLARLT